MTHCICRPSYRHYTMKILISTKFGAYRYIFLKFLVIKKNYCTRPPCSIYVTYVVIITQAPLHCLPLNYKVKLNQQLACYREPSCISAILYLFIHLFYTEKNVISCGICNICRPFAYEEEKINWVSDYCSEGNPFPIVRLWAFPYPTHVFIVWVHHFLYRSVLALLLRCCYEYDTCCSVSAGMYR